MQTVDLVLSLASSLAELAWLYIQLYGLRTARWIYANPDGTLGTACGLAGAFVLAVSRKREALGWLLFLASNAGMIALGLRLQRPDIVVLQCGFTITSLLGLWRTSIKPRLHWNAWRGHMAGNPTILIRRLARGQRCSVKLVTSAFASDQLHLTWRNLLSLLLHGQIFSGKGLDVYLWRKPKAERPPVAKTHDYPACATFRGGRCTCD